MMRFILKALIGCLSFSLVCSDAYSAEAKNCDEEKPNVVFLISHCLGFSDLGCYGGEIDTPNLDKLAAKGVRFINANNQCSRTPSMVHLISGLDPHRLGNIEGTKKGYLKTINKTKGEFPHHNLPELFAKAGYKTVISGKPYGWSPELIGFQEREGVSQDKVTLVWKDGKPPKDRDATKDDVVYADEQGSLELAKWIQNTDGPFFAMWMTRFSMYGLFAKDADIAKYHAQYQKPATQIAEARYRKAVELGVLSSDWPWKNPVEQDEAVVGSRNATIFTDADLVADPDWKPGYGLAGVRQPKDFGELMAVYAAQTHALDRSAGHILKALEEKGISENTIVVFLVLQGADAHSGSKGNTWAKVTATPFTGKRRTSYSGGITTPQIFSWPAKISDAGKGSINPTNSNLGDWMPTLLSAAGIAYPEKDGEGRSVLQADGKNLLPTLNGKTVATTLENAVCHEILTNKAVITDDWKWVGKGSNAVLYNFKTDRLETKDVSKDHPDIAKQMAEKYKAWSDEVGADPDFYAPKKKKK